MNKHILKVVLGLSLICCVSYCIPISSYVCADSSAEITVKAKSAILMDYNTGEVLVGQNENEKYEIASMVKLMTTYLTIKSIESGNLKLDDELTASEYASSMGGSQVFIDVGSKYPINKMLQSVIMASANDASVALGERIAGSEEAFVNMMNQTAIDLGMVNTHYANATGLPAPMQFSTAYDTAIILSHLVPNEIYHKYATMWMDELTHPSGRKTEIVNTNKLTRYYKGCDCGKTGFTDEAGYCLASSTKRDEMRLISVVIGAKSAKERFSESVNLFNYGFNNFENKLIIDKKVPLGNIEVRKSQTTTIGVYPKENYYILTKKGINNNNVEIKVDYKDYCVAPCKQGDFVGSIFVTKQGNVLKEIDAIINEDIKALTYGEAINKVINNWK